MEKNDTIFIVTGAHSIKSAMESLLRERYIEYMIALHKIFTYNKDTYGVLSEYNENVLHIPPFSTFPFKKNLKLEPDTLKHCTTKSQREFYSIQLLVKDMQIDDDVFVIKVSGRYVILKDTFFNIVESMKNDLNVNGVVCITEQTYPLQQYTFLFALRWKWFKKFYSLPLEELGGKCVERFIIEFFEKENLIGSIMNVDKLDILTQICNENIFRLF